MSNRLVDLEQNLRRRQPNARRRNTAPTPIEDTDALLPNAPQNDSAKGLSARVSRWPTGGGRARRSRQSGMGRAHQRVQGLETLAYDVPGDFWVMAQPSGMSCWATTYTMLKSWREQRQMTIPEALTTVGQRWVDLYEADTGLSGADKPIFLASAGLAAKPPQSFAIPTWESMLRQYGPIWITTDERPGMPGGIHARIVTGIYGDGTAAGTFFKIVDPSGGRRYEESIAVFIPKYEEEVRATGNLRIQVVHWQRDAVSQQQSAAFNRTRQITRAFQGNNLPAPPTVQASGLDYAGALAAHQQARALSAIDTRYNVQLVPQLTGFSCWAAGFAMIVGWRDQMSIDPSEIARATGYWQQYQQGLNAEDLRVMNTWGLVPAPLQTLTVEGFANLLQSYGPLWVASAEPGPHIRVVTGMKGDGTADGTLVYINDPWEQGMTAFQPNNRGAQYTETYRQFVEKQSTLARQEANLEAPVYVAHLPQLPSWMRSPVAQSFSEFVGHAVAMESPSNPENFRLLTSGTWNRNSTLTVQGGMAMWFKIRNTNVLGTTIRISDQSGQVKQSIILPASGVEFVFSVFGAEPMGWRFDIQTDSDAFMVTWELWSTWVQGMPPNG